MIKVLFVCHANICRSTALQAVFETLVKKEGLEDKIYTDSCGVSAHFSGKDVDPSMEKALKLKGYKSNHKSRVILNSDLEEFNYILPISEEMCEMIKSYTRNQKEKEKIQLVTNFSSSHKGENIKDPYSGAESGFDEVVLLSEEIARVLLDHIKKNDLK